MLIFYVVCFIMFSVEKLKTTEKYKQENKIRLPQLIVTVLFAFW